MLNEHDIAWMKANRAEMKAGRTEPVTIVTLEGSGEDPITGEPIQTEARRTVDVVWKEVSTLSGRREERTLVGGIELMMNDVQVTFDADVDLTAVSTVERKGQEYAILSVDEKGIGAINRQEVLARKVN
jgi:hypothetical protein